MPYILIFVPTKGDIDTRIIEHNRVEYIITGFGDYMTSASGDSICNNKLQLDLIKDLAGQILDLLATYEETPLQEICIEKLDKII